MIKQCRACMKPLTLENTAPSFLERGFTICRHCNEKATKKLIAFKRIEIIKRLGNKCQCCGITEYCFLSIDHIMGGGHQESKKCRGKQYINKLIKMPQIKLIAKYQCLCFNCNYSKGFWGICPHTFINDESLIDNLPIANKTISNINLSKGEHRERKLILRRIQNIQLRLETVKAYGSKCVSCYEIHPLFMTLDHIHNNGSHDDKGHDFYAELRRLGYPGKNTQLQLMCHNCNAKKEYTNTRFNNVITLPSNYIVQSYSITKEEIAILNKEARNIYNLTIKSLGQVQST